MNNNESSASDVINGNWTLKRKRKKIGALKSNGNKNDLTPSDSSDCLPSKKKRDDPCHECDVCNLGGDLIHCDVCPKTYHISCLDPPLKQLPSDKWQCPNCCFESKTVDTIDKLESTSKRARTRVPTEKVRSNNESEKTDKVSRSMKNTKKSTRKAKALTVGPKVDGSSERSSSSQTDVEETEIIKNKKKRDRNQSKEAATEKFERKRNKINIQKKNRRRDNDSLEVSETSKSQQKRKSVKHAKTKSLSKDKMKVGANSSESQEDDEKVNLVKHSDKIQLVDLVLGCRIQVTEKQSAQSVTEADKTPSQDSICNIQDVVNDGSTGQHVSDSNDRSTGQPVSDPNDGPTDERDKDGLELKSDDLTKTTVEIVNGDDTNGKSLSNNEKKTVSYEFLVKWAGKSNLHNTLVSESELKILAKRKLDNYKYKYGTMVINICEERWKVPQRIIAQQSTSESTEVFVKCTGLPYDQCTWENINEPVIEKSSHLIDLFNQFETEAVKKDDFKNEVSRGKGDVITLTEQPKELGGSLFPHQLKALNWLRKCWSRGKNVILADEMGLGKTISASAFLSSLYSEFNARLPSLVLVPLSTMPNWMSEFSVWAPHLNVVEYHGCASARALMRQFEWHANDTKNKKTSSYKFNVLLTTYEMVLADSSHLCGIPWEVLVVDEGHRLKNSSSKLFSLLNTFSFLHRVLLTGTPLQNNIGEMYNLLNFLQPSSFQSLSAFEDRFNDLSTAEKVDELKKLVAPHMLRRLKKDAMQNIPPKTERIVLVELSIQAEYYRAMLTKNYQVLRNIGKGIPQQSMLNIVMQLRKVCNHPYLIPGTEPEAGSVEFLHDMRIKASAKLALLHWMLKILKKEGHRVLIFSQMTKLLDILEDYLNIEFGPKTFERVDGSVSIADRQMAIQRFNNDKSRFVFLLSTRACGLGINLATADTVIIYDSDFNPHADIQAMNRAHRIGQSNRLLVYRLVVRASVEERILQLAKKKLMLDQLFVNKSGSQKEVEDILRWGTEELFNDSSSQSGKDGENDGHKVGESVTTEHKNKRRTGGLGDVYQDKCTDWNSTIVWDESAILKLLDRSNLENVSSDNGEGDLENDMLGSVKSLDWNDESTDEQGGSEALVDVIDDDNNNNNSEKKDDNNNSGNVAEENEWDRLLRVRWEKYQSEEEAALGRGKRQRKAVSYREAYAPRPIETLENGGDVEPEPEPVREYTPAGRALKTK
ncbi:LOW QUALITY PROTEIN: protein CHROMATIN REMODELING 4-like [Bidens hawaiensis]|uniref:LOW QUALITY PROTEIN: protein CHROMATIN REMODELING 4-like n=1 Tax=Bidens hawaiensis TaxID=980011 RepID=UPI0040491F49